MGRAPALNERMTPDPSAQELVGYCAAFLTTISFLPQAWLTFRTRDVRGISLGMYCVFAAGVALWLAYGLLTSAWPIVAANGVTLLLAACILANPNLSDVPIVFLTAAATPTEVRERGGLIGGLPFLAPFHSLVAWTFATFIVGHVYMTTTGATPLEAMRGMVTGYEEVEVHEHSEQVMKEGDAS